MGSTPRERPSKYRGVRLHCGVGRSLHARFRGDRPGSFGMIDVADRQTEQTFIDIEIYIYMYLLQN